MLALKFSPSAFISAFSMTGTCSRFECWRFCCRIYQEHVVMFSFDAQRCFPFHFAMFFLTGLGGRMTPFQPIPRQQCRVGFSKQASSLFLGETESWLFTGRCDELPSNPKPEPIILRKIQCASIQMAALSATSTRPVWPNVLLVTM